MVQRKKNLNEYEGIELYGMDWQAKIEKKNKTLVTGRYVYIE